MKSGVKVFGIKALLQLSGGLETRFASEIRADLIRYNGWNQINPTSMWI